MKRGPGVSLDLAARTCATIALGLQLVAVPVAAQTPANAQPKVGGTLRLGSWAGRGTLNPYLANSKPTNAFTELIFDGLARVASDGSYLPNLAQEIPTQANGDVSTDGTVVTWKLKPGVMWSDGQPFTSHDVVFTYQVLMDPSNPVANRSDYTVMNSVAASDAYTVVVTYKHLYAPYRLAFPAILPAHVFNDRTDIAQDPFNTAPNVTTGPFVVTSVVSGDSVTFDRNPNYREPGKPYLDEVIVKFTPDRNAEIQALEAGDLDAAYWLDESYLMQLAALSDVRVDPVAGPTSGVLNLYLNASCSSGPQQGDPACPHPILGDVRVRQAIDTAIDKQAIVHNFLGDKSKVAGSVLPVGPYAVDLAPGGFNPDGARQLLEEAGWSMGSDGVRSKSGVRMHVSLFATAGATLADEVAQVIEENLRDVGVEVKTQELSVGVFAQTPGNFWSLGGFDLALFGSVLGVDPQAFLNGHFASSQVPSAESQTGQNFDRVLDPQLDQALGMASNTLDDTQRLAAFRAAAESISADESVIPLYPQLQVDARKAYVQGWQANGNDSIMWNVQDWWLNK